MRKVGAIEGFTTEIILSIFSRRTVPKNRPSLLHITSTNVDIIVKISSKILPKTTIVVNVFTKVLNCVNTTIVDSKMVENSLYNKKEENFFKK